MKNKVILKRGQHTSSLACTQRLTDTKCCLPLSPLAWLIDVRHVLPISPSTCTKWSANIEWGLPESPLACTQQLDDVRHGLPTSSVPRTHRSAEFEHGLQASSIAYTHWSVDVKCCMSPLSVTCTHHLPKSYSLSTNVHSLHISVCRCQQTTSYISHGMHIYNVACAHQESNVGQLHVASANSCTHKHGMYVYGNR